ncbi:MAG: hypothetical protein ACREF0_06670 [Acetobacteraceae bacterium]
MALVLAPPQLAALRAYSQGELTALELRRLLDGATYGDILRLLGEHDLKLPKAPQHGREEHLARARAWLFPAHAA